MRNVFVAGVLGGLLGAGGAFSAGRLVPVKAAEPVVNPTTATPDPLPRQVAESLLARLKVGKGEEFTKSAKASMHLISDQEFAVFQKNFTASRETYARGYGPSLGEFELVREHAASPSLVRLVYLERFEKHGLLWIFVMYRGKDGWAIAHVNWVPELNLAFAGGP